jgi:hypothetical protein
VDATAFVQEFDPKLIRYDYDKLTILVGCVDTAAGRSAINQALDLNQFYSRSEIPRVWYLDCGNHAAAGQILLGSSLETEPEFYNFGGPGCARLPSPVFLAPDILKPKPEKLTNNLFRAEMAMLNLQSESVNIRAANYLYGWLRVISKSLLPILIWRLDSAIALHYSAIGMGISKSYCKLDNNTMLTRPGIVLKNMTLSRYYR